MLYKRNKKFFGHSHIFTGYGGTPYFKVEKGTIDGINRQHCPVYAKCDICMEEFRIGYIHATKDGNLFSPKSSD